MKSYKLIVKFLLLSMLWVSGVSVCKAQTVCCYGCTLYTESTDEGIGDWCVDTSASPTYCIDPDNSMVYPTSMLGGGACPGASGSLVPSTPLTDSTLLFVFLLGIYGIYTYRKRRGMQIELIEK